MRSFAYALLFGTEDFLLWLTPGATYGVAAGAAMAASTAARSIARSPLTAERAPAEQFFRQPQSAEADAFLKGELPWN